MITVKFEKLNIKPGQSILDIGCGHGRHTCSAYQLKSVTAIGCDINPNDLTIAREKLVYHDTIGAHGGGNWGLSAANILALPFKDNFFDVVICSEVLEHIPKENDAIKEIIRVLKPGCHLIISVPSYLPERICWLLAPDYGNANQGHIRIYRKNKLIHQLEQCGVSHWASHQAHSLHSPYWWLKCLVGPTREDSLPVNLYHRFLVWDIMAKPRLTRFIDQLLNPILGKSLVLYFTKTAN